MFQECPNCRGPVPWYRLFFTTAWGRWKCDACGAVLAPNVRRRFAVVGVVVALILLSSLITGRALTGPGLLGLCVLAPILAVMVLDRPAVVERTGFRCRGCGYDLQGQVEARCPECGEAFDPRQSGDVVQAGAAMRSFRSRRSIAVLVILALTFSATVGLVIYTKYSRLAGAVAIPGTEPVLNALLAYAADNAGRGPDHAIRLVVDDRLTTGDFVSPHTVTVAESVPLADTTLAQFANLSPERKQTVAAAAASLLGDGVVAHRLGDFVFTHHGIDLTNPDPGLWLVAWLPDPSQNTPPDPQERAPVGLAGGEVIQITLSSLSESVSAQNVLRAEQGLLPLPNPFTVTHARPAAAGPQAGRTGFGSTP